MNKTRPCNRNLGTSPKPMMIIASLRWLGKLSPDDIVTAIKRGAARPHPDLGAAEIHEMCEQAASMTKSRLRAWKGSARNSADPTWLEVRALIAGLYETVE